jgi:hypothetical protein
VTRDGFDFLVYYLPDFDYASHALGPEDALPALERADGCLATLLAAAGGFDAFFDRYALLVSADHGQTSVRRVARLEEAYADLRLLSPRRPDPERSDVFVAASNRAGMVYRLGSCPLDVRGLAERLDGEPAADVVLFREDGGAVARRGGEEARFRLTPAGLELEGSPDLLDAERYPDGYPRAWAALACPRAGDVVVSLAEGYELADLGGRHHLGGGSHGSLLAGDSLVPMIATGFEAEGLPARPGIADLAGVVLAHFEIEPPAAMGARTHVHA